MCDCNKKKYDYVKNLVLRLKNSEPDKQYAIYKSVIGYNFCELQSAKDNNFNIIEIV